MDDKQASSNAQINDDSTLSEHVTSSLCLPVLNSGSSENHLTVSGRQCQSLHTDETTESKRSVQEPTDNNLLITDARTAPETETVTNDTVENGTSNENYIRFADEEDDSLAYCNNEIDKRENIFVSIQTTDNFQMPGNILSGSLNVLLFSRAT